MANPPLRGVRILSLAEQYPGPYASMLLADLGAEVILVERPQGGDPSRRFTGLFSALNRNKQSVTLDLKSGEGRDQFLQLVDTADVVMEGFRPGVMARLKIDAEALRQRKPDLIYVSISSFGQHGPWSGIAGHDLSIQGALGMLQSTPGQESRKDVPMLPMADISSGIFAALGIVTALYSRAKTAQGHTLDISMLDSLVSWMTPILTPPLNQLPLRDLPPLDPGYGIFSTKDGRQLTLSIAGEDAMWQDLCRLLALDDLAALNENARSAMVLEIDPVLRDAIRQWRYNDLYAELERLRIAFGPVLGLAEALNNPQLEARKIVQAFTDGASTQRYITQPVLFDGSHFKLERGVPGLGQHNHDVLTSLKK